MHDECSYVLRPQKKRKIQNSHEKLSKHEKFCSVCNLVLSANCTFVSHMEFHKQTLPMIIDWGNFFRCGNCLTVFCDADALDQHLQHSDNCIKNYDEDDKSNCVDYQFLEDQNFIDTSPRLCSCSKSIDEDDLIMCDCCLQFSGNSVEEILDHCINAHFSEETEQTNVYDVVPQFEEHLETIHKCGVCFKTFPTFKDTACHTYFHSSKFVCPYQDCSDTYSKFFLLNQHLERNHVQGREYQCSYCLQIFGVYYDYRSHLRNDCTLRMFPCSMCGMYFY